ncbi:hypothetical protein WEI85_06965 [Actinomycetes bacterium KLBMP 9797]
MSNTATRVLHATIAIALAAGLAACQAGTAKAPPVATEPPPAAEPTPAAAPAPSGATPTPTSGAGSKTRRPRTAGPDPCDEVHRSTGDGPTQMGPHTIDELYLVRASRGRCVDQVIFRVNGTAGFGAHAGYVARAQAARSGDPIEVRGGAVLEIVVFAPDFAHVGSGHQPGRDPWRIGQEVARVPSGWSALREVAYAGPNDGSETVFVIGVRERLPFTLTWRAGDGYSEVSLDIAHRRPTRTYNCACG